MPRGCPPPQGENRENNPQAQHGVTQKTKTTQSFGTGFDTHGAEPFAPHCLPHALQFHKKPTQASTHTLAYPHASRGPPPQGENSGNITHPSLLDCEKGL